MPDICRLCLQSDSEKYFRMDTEDYRHKMQSVIPEINIEMVEEPFICAKCSELLLSAYYFKSNCLQTDKELKTYAIDNEKRIKLDEFLKQKNQDVLSDVKIEIIDEDQPEKKQEASTLCKALYLGIDEETENPKQLVKLEQEEPKIKVIETLVEKKNEKKVRHGKVVEIITKRKQKPTIIQCDICNRIFLRKSSLDRHLMRNEHSKCTVCDLEMPCKASLEEHMRSHTGERPFQCTYCGKAFTQSGTLGTHVRSLHMSERPYVCEVCGMSFPVRSAYTAHKRRRHDAVEKKFICSFCGKAYLIKSKLKQHMIWHTGERNYSCRVCSKSFVDNGSLTMHIRTHNGNKPFCQKTFTKNYNKQVHFKSCSRKNARNTDAK